MTGGEAISYLHLLEGDPILQQYERACTSTSTHINSSIHDDINASSSDESISPCSGSSNIANSPLVGSNIGENVVSSESIQNQGQNLAPVIESTLELSRKRNHNTGGSSSSSTNVEERPSKVLRDSIVNQFELLDFL